VTIGCALLATIPLSAHAADIWINQNGGIGATYKSSYGTRTGAYAEDVKADSHRVEVDYYRYSTSNPMYRLTDADGSAAGTYKYAERSGYIVSMKVCVVNSNPFDWQKCTGWYS